MTDKIVHESTCKGHGGGAPPNYRFCPVCIREDEREERERRSHRVSGLRRCGLADGHPGPCREAQTLKRLRSAGLLPKGHHGPCRENRVLKPGELWCHQVLDLEHEPYAQMDPSYTDAKLSVWPEGTSEGENPRPIFAMTIAPRSADGAPYMWISGAQARELAMFLLEWTDAMEASRAND